MRPGVDEGAMPEWTGRDISPHVRRFSHLCNQSARDASHEDAWSTPGFGNMVLDLNPTLRLNLALRSSSGLEALELM